MSDSVVTFPGPREDVQEPAVPAPDLSKEARLALLEAVIFAAEEPPTLDQLAEGLGWPKPTVEEDIQDLLASYGADSRGVEIRAVGGAYRMYTKPEHHEAVKAFVKTIQPRLRLSPAALETLAVVAYRQPVTIPEIQAIRGIASAGGVIHTLLRHKLIGTAGRKKVVGRPMRYKTTKEFLVHFGLNDLSELPTLKEMEELSRAAFDEDTQIALAAAEESASEESAAGEASPEGPSPGSAG